MILYNRNKSRYEIISISIIKDSYTRNRITNFYDIKFNYSNIGKYKLKNSG